LKIFAQDERLFFYAAFHFLHPKVYVAARNTSNNFILQMFDRNMAKILSIGRLDIVGVLSD